jgi:hypothetical protein
MKHVFERFRAVRFDTRATRVTEEFAVNLRVLDFAAAQARD